MRNFFWRVYVALIHEVQFFEYTYIKNIDFENEIV